METASAAISFAIILGGFLYGAFHLFRSKTPLYFKLLVSASACLSFERLSALVNYLTDSYYYVTLGGLGVFGALLFLLSSNYGALNSIVDDGSGTRKYRTIAIIGPIASACALAYIFAAALPLGTAIAAAILIILLPLVPASYFTIKHLILPTDTAGLLKGTRLSNLCALLYYIFLVISTMALLKDKAWGNVFSILASLCAALIAVFAVKGEKQWKM